MAALILFALSNFRAIAREFLNGNTGMGVRHGASKDLDIHSKRVLGRAWIPEVHQDLIEAVYFAGFSIQQCAELFGIGAGAVRYRLDRVRRRLKTAYLRLAEKT